MILLDAASPDLRRSLSTRDLFMTRIKYHAKRLARRRGAAIWDYMMEQVGGIMNRVRSQGIARTPFVDKLQYAARSYRPNRFAGSVTLLRPADRPDLPSTDLGWSQVVEGVVKVCEVSGDHLSMFYEPNVEALAMHIRASLPKPEGGRRSQPRRVASGR